MPVNPASPIHCKPTSHNFIAVDASPHPPTGNNQLIPHQPKIVKIFCTKCGEVRPLE